MPNRILRDYTDSEKMDIISPQAETCFTRLISKADDFGKFHGHPTLLKSALFPLKVDRITDKQMDGWMDELYKAKLIVRYVVNGKKYLKINDFGQRLRLMQSKFPDPIIDDRTMTAESQHDDGVKRNEVETDVEEEVETETTVLNCDVFPTFEDFWNLYDKKEDRKDAIKKWEKLNQLEKEYIMSFIPNYKLSLSDLKYQRNPVTFINKRTWENELPKPKDNHQTIFKNDTELTDFINVRPHGK